jgi:hypothetical protein
MICLSLMRHCLQIDYEAFLLVRADFTDGAAELHSIIFWDDRQPDSLTHHIVSS